MGFTLADGKIWIRCFQISETEISKSDTATAAGTVNGTGKEAEGAVKTKANKKGERGETKLSLTEIGPRFVLTPIVILESSFGGPVIYENKEFVSPNQIRSELRLGKAGRYARRSEQGVDGKAKKGELGLRSGERRRSREGDELDERVLFA